ncbi:uncharacterized protein LOC143126355 isoform X2 [Alosa pseudoharengus]|uniref:uncharacterized protein LOC143126355 isoform X2 n=1 Tax=Alosa pseudoharengus TaxID=34774 RepID=UPI003F8B68F6
MEVAVPEEPQKKVFRARKTMKARDRPQLEVLHNTLLTVSANTATPPSSSPSSSTSSTIPASMVNGTHSDDGVKATAKSKEPGKEKTKEKEKTATVNGPSSNSPAPATPASGSASPHLGLSLSRSPSPSTQSLKPSAAVTKNGERRMGEKTEEEMEVDTDMDKEKGNEKKEEEEGETESKKNEGKASRSSSPTELASAAATDATSSRKKRPPSPDREKSEEKAGEATTEEERGGKRLRVEGLELEVEAQIELKITEGAADSRLKIEKVVQKLVEERLRVLELTVFDRTLQELKERVEKIDCATKHQGTLNTLQARIARLVKKFGAANQASENSRKVQEELKKTPLAPQVNTAATTGITNGIRALHPNGGAGGVVSVTTACAPTQSAAAVVGVATSSSANPASSVPAVTGAAAPATPSASAMASKTDNQVSSSTAVKAAAQTVVKCPPASSLRQGTAVYLVTKKPMLLCDDKGWMANMESRLAARTADLTSERARAAQLLAENASLKVETDNLRQELQGLRETSQTSQGGSAGIGEPHSALHSTAPEFDSSMLLDYHVSLSNSIRMTGQRPDVSLRHFGPEDHARLHTLSFGQVGRYGCLLFRHIISEENYKAWSKTTNWDGSRGKRALPQNVRTFVVATLKRHFPDMDRGELKECIDKINEFLRTTRKNS